MILCGPYSSCWISNPGCPSENMYLYLNSHAALLTWFGSNWLNGLCPLGTKLVFQEVLKQWCGSVCGLMHSCLPASCDVWKELRIRRDFHPSFPHLFLAACELCSGLKNLEVRLLISRNREPGQPEKQRNKRQAALFMKAVVSAAAAAYF